MLVIQPIYRARFLGGNVVPLLLSVQEVVNIIYEMKVYDQFLAPPMHLFRFQICCFFEVTAP